MADLQAQDPLKADVPSTTFGKILAATPVVMTVISTLLAGLASSEMTKAQYDRSLAAQQQSKAGDQWSYFQSKRLRSALQQNTLDLLRATADVHPLDLAALKSAAAKPETTDTDSNSAAAVLDSPSGREALEALANLTFHQAAVPPLDPRFQAVIDAIAAEQTDAQLAALLAPLKPADINAALQSARERANAFDTKAKSITHALDQIEGTLSKNPGPSAAPLKRDFTAARLAFGAQRYEIESRLNQSIGSLHEVQVHLSNFIAERHRNRSDQFFYGMLIAQAAVICSTLAMAARQRNVLWTVAAVAGFVAIGFAIYVYLCI